MHYKNNPKAWAVGTRVKFRRQGDKVSLTGTVVGRVAEMEGGYVDTALLICTDLIVPGGDTLNQYTGDGRGVVLDLADAKLSALGSHGYWNKAPSNIVGVVIDDFKYDSVNFKKGEICRVFQNHTSSRPQSQGPIVTVSWKYKKNPNFNRLKNRDGAISLNCWQIPLNKIRFGIIEEDGTIIYWPLWKEIKDNLKVGDLITVAPMCLEIMGHDGRSEMVLETAVLKLSLKGDSHNKWHAIMVGGCDRNFLGCGIHLNSKYASPLKNPEKFFGIDCPVTIVAEVSWKKIQLQGKSGKVVLPTDYDGDVGVEFSENIGAGSLDGVGTQGHCVYLPAEALKSSA